MPMRGPWRPPRLLAIVHDLELEPSWREEWIAGALHEAVRIIEERGLISIALETLGTKHGALPPHRFCELLASVLRDTKLSRLRRIWLITNPGTDRYAFKALEDHDPMSLRYPAKAMTFTFRSRRCRRISSPISS